MSFPKEAYKPSGERMSLDEFILGNVSPVASASFIMQVGSESMVENGIFPGDYLIVERTSSANPGDLVVVSDGRDFLLKYLSIISGRQDNLRLEAVVRAVIRKC